MTFATSGERVRSFTSETRLGRIRSNDHANKLRVAIRKVAGSATMKAMMKEKLIRPIRKLDLVSIETKKKKNAGEPNGYALLPLFERNVAEPRKSLPKVRLARPISNATSAPEISSDQSMARIPELRGERTSPPA